MMALVGVLYASATALSGLLTDKYGCRIVAMTAGALVMMTSCAMLDVTVYGLPAQGYVYPGVMFALLEAGSASIQVSVLPLLVFHDRELDMETSTQVGRVPPQSYYA